jgi:hypothetical protein
MQKEKVVREAQVLALLLSFKQRVVVMMSFGNKATTNQRK